MKTIRALFYLLPFVLLLILTACGLGTAQPTSTPEATATRPPQTGTIAFVKFASEAQTEEDIYTIKSDGTGLTLLAHETGIFMEYPAWSPDGTKIAFQSMTGTYHTSTIWVMNADGSDRKQLIQLPRTGLHPAWSPDGKQIAFSGFSTEDDWIHIFVMNAEGGNIHQVTSGGTNDGYPIWAQDGTILFVRSTPPIVFGEVFAINPDGSGLVQLTKNELTRGFALSPDGKRLAVFRGAAFQIVVHPKDTPGNEVLLMEAFVDCDDVRLSWSPDGKAIAVAESTLDALKGPSDLNIVNTDGSGLKKITEAGKVFDPAWRP